ncbi:MAG: hypothetical protein M3472_06465 [Chloroflexota bacterium]|nr:hypothetical protein [Chloroflexota bacterium]
MTAPSEGAVTREYEGTVPAGTGGTVECVEGVNADRYTFTIDALPADFYDTRDGTLRFRIRWSPTEPNDIATQDLLLRVVAPDGTTLDSDGGSPSEVVVFVDPIAGAYEVYACAFAVILPQFYLGDVTLDIASKDAAVPNPPSTPTSLRFGPIITVDPQRDVAEPSLRVDKDGNEYTCGPFGASKAAEYANKSEDGGDTFRVLGLPPEGRIAPGGGGDCELAVARKRNDEGFFTLAYTGLAALVNFSTSSSTNAGRSFLGNAVSESPVVVDRQWMDAVGEDTVYLTYRQIPLGSFVQRSTDGGLTYGPGTLIIEEIDRSGNLIVDRRAGRDDDVYIIYAFDGAVKLARSTDADALTPAYELITIKPACADGTAESDFPTCTQGRPDNIFPSIAQDKAGNLYAAWTEAGTYNTYYSYSTDSGTTWSPKVQVNRDDVFSTVLPWIDAGDDGRVAISFYGSVIDGNPQLGSFRGPWDVYVNTVTNAHSLPADPNDKAVSQTKVTTHPIHWNSICLSGLGCSLTNPPGDRTLLDLFQVKHDPEGRIRVTYNESNKRYDEDFGQIAIVTYSKQTAGPDLIGEAEAPDLRPRVAFGRSDPTGDAQYPFSFFPSPTAPPSPPFRTNYPALDFESLKARPGTVDSEPGVTFTMKLADLSPLALTTAQAGLVSPNLLYVARFFSGFEAHAAVASVDATGAFTFGYTDLTLSPDGKLQTYQPTTPIPGSVDPATGRITMTVPYSLIEHVAVDASDPAAPPTVRDAQAGDKIFEVTGFTFGNNTGDPFTQLYLNQGDSTYSFDYRLGSSPASSVPPALSIDDVTVTEADSTVYARFTVSLSRASDQAVSVDFATRDGTARAPADYTAKSGSLEFQPGQVAKGFRIAIRGEDVREDTERFFIDLSDPVNATIADGTGIGRIRDDDPDDPVVHLSKSGPAEASRGETFLYTIGYENVGPFPSANARITDVLPRELAFVRAGSGGVFDSETRRVSWSLGTVGVREPDSVRLKVRVKRSVASGTLVTNRADFTGDATTAAPAFASTRVR